MRLYSYPTARMGLKSKIVLKPGHFMEEGLASMAPGNLGTHAPLRDGACWSQQPCGPVVLFFQFSINTEWYYSVKHIWFYLLKVL